MTPFHKGAVYRRISRDVAGDASAISRQAEDIDALASARGVPVVARFEDNDLSATQGRHRPGYAALTAAVQRSEVDVIVVTYLSRLWRNRRERAEGIELLRKHGVSVICVKGPELDLTTAAGRLLAGLLGEVDSFEVEQMSEREERKMRQAVERGAPPTGPRCFGYTSRGDELIVREAREVEQLFTALLAGATLSGLAADLNARGVLNRNGRPWSHNAVRGVLLNERYANLREYRGELYVGSWPQIVDEAVWRKAVTILTDDARATSPGPARKWLLSGLATCGVCGDGTTVTSAQRGTKAVEGAERTYRCRRTKHLNRKAQPIDDLIANTDPARGPLGVIIQRLARPDAADLLVDDSRADMEELQRQARTLRARLEALGDAFADDDHADPREFRAAGQRLRVRLAEVEAEMAHPDRAPVLAELVGADDVAAVWDALPLDRQRAVLDCLVTVNLLPGKAGRRPFDPETIEITWKS